MHQQLGPGWCASPCDTLSFADRSLHLPRLFYNPKAGDIHLFITVKTSIILPYILNNCALSQSFPHSKEQACWRLWQRNKPVTLILRFPNIAAKRLAPPTASSKAAALQTRFRPPSSSPGGCFPRGHLTQTCAVAPDAWMPGLGQRRAQGPGSEAKPVGPRRRLPPARGTGREGRGQALRQPGPRPPRRHPAPRGRSAPHAAVTGQPAQAARALRRRAPHAPSPPLPTPPSLKVAPRPSPQLGPGPPDPAPGPHRTWAGSGTRSWTGCPPPPRPRAAGSSGPPWPPRPRRPARLTAAAGPAPGLGVGCPPRPAGARRCGSGGGGPPARRAPSSAGPGRRSAEGAAGWAGGAAAASGRVMSAAARARGPRRPRPIAGRGGSARALQPMGGGMRRERRRLRAGRGRVPRRARFVLPRGSRLPRSPRGRGRELAPHCPRRSAPRKPCAAPALGISQPRPGAPQRGAPTQPGSPLGSRAGTTARCQHVPRPQRLGRTTPCSPTSGGSRRLVSAGDPLGRCRGSSPVAPFSPLNPLHAAYGSLGPSCSPEVRSTSAQDQIRRSSAEGTFWKL